MLVSTGESIASLLSFVYKLAQSSCCCHSVRCGMAMAWQWQWHGHPPSLRPNLLTPVLYAPELLQDACSVPKAALLPPHLCLTGPLWPPLPVTAHLAFSP